MKKITKKPALPTIRIMSEREEVYSILSLEMDDKAFTEIVKIGKDVITPEDYFQIGFLYAVHEFLAKEEKSKPKAKPKRVKK